ncbi:MAG TPA: PAS domain S-box protein, partial [Methanomicrobiales archaeon]|nr:PAS domain S-box protein [Methanomicrobiales archaeon]
LFENLLDGYAYCRMIFRDGRAEDFVYLDVNPSFGGLTGLQDVVGRRVTEVIPGVRESNPELFEIYGRVAQTGRPERFETFLPPLGRWFSVAVFSPEREHFVAIFENITERKLAEEDLRKSEEILNETGHLARIGGWEHDLVTGRATWTRTLYEIDELESGPPPGPGEHLDQYPPPYRAALETAYRRAVETGEPFDLELQVCTAKKNLIWGRVIGRPVMENGRCVRMTGAFQDITDRKRAEVERENLINELEQKNANLKLTGEALRETSAYLENLIGYANTPIIVWDPGMRITRFNRAFEQLTGLASPDVVGREVDNLFPEQTREESLGKIRSSMTGKRWELIEIPIRRSDGSVRTVLWNSANLYGPEGKTLVATIAQGQDVTDLRRTTAERENLIRELEQKNAELERFTYTASHDLKSPLITIKGFLGFLEEDARNANEERTKADIARIRHAADQMQDLLGDLLQLSRVGRIVNPPTRVSFGELAREAVDLVAGEILKRNARVTIAPDLPDVYGDRARLLEVMQNLVENAVKFMGDQPEPRIEIGMGKKDGKTAFFVRDNGIGIDPKFQGRIFGLFEKLDKGTEGTGVGLALAKRIIEHHGGRIWVESEGTGKGSTFWFSLPGPPAGAANHKRRAADTPSHGAGAGGTPDHPAR